MVSRYSTPVWGATPALIFLRRPGASIPAASSGILRRADFDSIYGNVIVIDHGDGLQSPYAHASTELVSVGDSVWQGPVIALVGSSGQSSASDVHFEIRKNENSVGPGVLIEENSEKMSLMSKRSIPGLGPHSTRSHDLTCSV